MANDYYNAYKRQRKTWDRNPVEQVVLSKKEYNRNAAKNQIKEVINEELDMLNNYDDIIYSDVDELYNV